MAGSIIRVVPQEIITEILLKLPPKPLLKFKCLSKSCNELISSPQFVKTHLKLSANIKDLSYHRALYQDGAKNFKVCSLSSLFNKEPSSSIEGFDMTSPAIIVSLTVGSVNGLIYLFNETSGEAVLWNPTIRKSKKLSNFGLHFTRGNPTRCGFGYDALNEDYKAVLIEYVSITSSFRRVVKIYSLKTDSWKTVGAFEGGKFINDPGEFVNGKLYWASSDIGDNDLVYSKIISFDLTDEKWEMLELPSCVKRPHLKLGVVGSDLSLLSAPRERASFDVWIMKDRGVKDVTWTKMITINYPPDVLEHVLICPSSLFSVHFSETHEGEILVMLGSVIMIYNPKDGSTRYLEVAGFDKVLTAQIYVESLVDPLVVGALATP